MTSDIDARRTPKGADKASPQIAATRLGSHTEPDGSDWELASRSFGIATRADSPELQVDRARDGGGVGDAVAEEACAVVRAGFICSISLQISGIGRRDRVWEPCGLPVVQREVAYRGLVGK
jgi:hypothetical protein